jgi:hypothetical protein
VVRVKKRLEVLVKGEGLARSGGLGGGRCIGSSPGIIRHTLSEEVGLALDRDHIHKVEGVHHVVYPVVNESY